MFCKCFILHVTTVLVSPVFTHVAYYCVKTDAVSLVFWKGILLPLKIDERGALNPVPCIDLSTWNILGADSSAGLLLRNCGVKFQRSSDLWSICAYRTKEEEALRWESIRRRWSTFDSLPTQCGRRCASQTSIIHNGTRRPSRTEHRCCCCCCCCNWSALPGIKLI